MRMKIRGGAEAVTGRQTDFGAILTEATCADACWQAREDVCRCSCGGRNHGIARHGGRADRTRRVGPMRYRLMAIVGSEGPRDSRRSRELRAAEAARALDAPPCSYGGKVTRYGRAHVMRTFWQEPTPEQIERWPELEPYRGQPRPFLVWTATDWVEQPPCPCPWHRRTAHRGPDGSLCRTTGCDDPKCAPSVAA